MKRALLGLGLLLAGCGETPPADAPRTVATVDLPRYLGTWYEIARLPDRFQDGGGRACERVTATYTTRPDGRIGVLNRCDDAGTPRDAKGQAYAVAGSGGARLRVSFFWPFYGDYWVIGLDPDYRWAVVGNPDRTYLWVLSRSPAMAPPRTTPRRWASPARRASRWRRCSRRGKGAADPPSLSAHHSSTTRWRCGDGPEQSTHQRRQAGSAHGEPAAHASSTNNAQRTGIIRCS